MSKCTQLASSRLSRIFTYLHDITELLLIVMLNTNPLTHKG